MEPIVKGLISVIMACYDTEKYVEKSICSVLNQSYKNLELILIDDGSCDRTGKICREYVLADERVKLISQENMGLSNARNAGLDAAAGEYISFVDSDDIIEPQMLETLLDILQAGEAQIAMCGYQKIDEQGEAINIKSAERRIGNTVFFEEELYDLLCKPAFYILIPVVWNKLYDRTIFDTLRFRDVQYCEDEQMIHELIHNAGKIAYIDEDLYKYRMRTGSISNANSEMFVRSRLLARRERVNYLKKVDSKMFQKTYEAYIKNVMYECMCKRSREFIIAQVNDLADLSVRYPQKNVKLTFFLRYPYLYISISKLIRTIRGGVI